MKILFLAHRIPHPPDKGEKIRAFHELKFLAARHTIDLFCLADSADEAANAVPLRDFCRRVFVESRNSLAAKKNMMRSFLRGEPLTSGFFYSPKLKREVRNALDSEQYDLVFVYCSSMTQYVPRDCKVPVVVDFVDIDSGKWSQYSKVAGFPRSWVYSREAQVLGRAEQRTAAKVALSIVTTNLEAHLLDPVGRYPVAVIANGVARLEADAVRTESATLAWLPAQIAALQPYVLFVGQMDYLPNIDAVEYFANDIFPLVRAKHPAARFVIAGRNPALRVRDLVKQEGVVVTGTVPEVQSYLLGAAAVVAPFRIAQGVQNKILEAFALGKPVVSTSRPAQAVGARDGETILVADEPAEFAQRVNEILSDPSMQKRFAGGREFVRQHFDWDTNLGRLENHLIEAAQASKHCVPDREVVERQGAVSAVNSRP
jgi:sugar transferase (PEP-CTERM/EpsH1 system associated)